MPRIAYGYFDVSVIFFLTIITAKIIILMKIITSFLFFCMLVEAAVHADTMSSGGVLVDITS